MSITRNILITTLSSFSLLISALIVDNSFYRKGWELPKVNFWHHIFLILIIISTVSIFYNLSRREIQFVSVIRENKLTCLFLTSIFFYFVFFLVSTTYIRDSSSLAHNSFYFNVINIFNPRTIVSLFGNEFRDFGMITIGLLSFFLIILVKSIRLKNYVYLLIALIFSSTVQSVIGIAQFFSLGSNNFRSFLSGEYIYGSFGQSNFYAGHILVGCLLLFSLVVMKKKFLMFSRTSLLVFLNAFLKYLLIINFIGLILSLSFWGIFCCIIGFILILLNRIISVDKFSNILMVFVFSLFAGFVPLALILVNYLKFFEQRLIIWKDILVLYSGQANSSLTLPNIAFGTGPDTLGDILSFHGKMQGLYVDRAHNIVMDILTSFGFIGLVMTVLLFFYLAYRVYRIRNSNLNYLYIIFLVLFIRLLVNTYSIVNIVDILVILSGCLILMRTLKHKSNSNNVSSTNPFLTISTL